MIVELFVLDHTRLIVMFRSITNDDGGCCHIVGGLVAIVRAREGRWVTAPTLMIGADVRGVLEWIVGGLGGGIMIVASEGPFS